MRVLHVYKEFHPSASGVARHMAGLRQASAALGATVRLFATQIDPAWAGDPGVLSGGWRALSAAVAAADLVHVHGARTPVALLAALLARLRGRAFIYTPHCYYAGGGWRKRLGKRLWDLSAERWLVRRAVATVLLAPVWIERLAALGLRPARVALVPNCIDLAAVRAAAAGTPVALAGAPSLLALGRLDPVKRLDIAIAALAEPGLARAELHLVGRGADQARLAALAERLGVADRVHWLGALADADAACLRPDLALLPSAEEGGPTVVLEMLARGIPILCGDGPGTRAMLTALGWPALVPSGDVAALAAAIPHWCRRPVPAAVEAALAEQFDWQSRARDLMDLYGDAIAKTNLK